MSPAGAFINDHVRLVAEITGYEGVIRGIRWSPNGQRLVTWSSGGQLRLWDVNPSRLRLSRAVTPHTIHSVDWSPDASLLACATEEGTLVVCDARTLETAATVRISASPLLCTGWSPEGQRLAVAGDDFGVYILEANPVVRLLKTYSGHQAAVCSLVWSPRMATAATAAKEPFLISGTETGHIGVWYEGLQDDQLRHFLPGASPWAHGGAVLSLAWSSTATVLASASSDRKIRLWDVEHRVTLGTFDCGEPAYCIVFSQDGDMLVARTLDKLRFIRCDRMEEVFSLDCPANVDLGSLSVHHPTSSIAAEDCLKQRINVWKADMRAMLREAKVQTRLYRNANVVFLGRPGTGKTNLVSVLAGKPFAEEASPHGLQSFRLPETQIYQDNGASEVQAIRLWDFPNGSNEGFVQRINLVKAEVEVLVLDCRTAAVTSQAVQELENILQNEGAGHRHPCVRLLAITQIDRAGRREKSPDLELLCQRFHIHRVFLTSAREGRGVDTLLEEIRAVIDWTAAPAVDFDTFTNCRNFVKQEWNKGLYVASEKSLYALFVASYSSDRGAASRELFRDCLDFLESLRMIHRFSWGDQILLEPDRFYEYAAALIAAARKDEDGLGRISTRNVYSEADHHPLLEDSIRIRDRKQEGVLLRAVVSEVLEAELAYEVSTSDESYLVFPTQPTLALPAPPPCNMQAAWCAIEPSCGGAMVYSSLVVRLLGLDILFPDAQTYQNAAVFGSMLGGRCGLMFRPEAADGSSRITVFFDEHATPLTREKFLGFARSHVETKSPQSIWTKNADCITYTPAQIAAVRVFFSYERTDPRATAYSDPRNQTKELEYIHLNVQQIGQHLKAHNIAPWIEDVEMRPGDGPDVRRRALESHNIGVITICNGMTQQMQQDLQVLRSRNCRIVPVILPGAPAWFTMPEELKGYTSVDFRRLDPNPYERLTQGIFAAQEAERRVLELAPAETAIRHVFLAYLRHDEAEVERLHNEIVAAGHPVWWDRYVLPGTDWKMEVRNAQRRAYAVVACFSRESLERGYSGIYPEIDYAIEIANVLSPNSIFLIPVLFSTCQIPQIRINNVQFLEDLQSIDLSRPNREAQLAILMEALRKARGNRFPNSEIGG